MNKTLPVFLVCFSVLLISACRKDVPPKKDNNFGSISSDKRIFVGNEGTFGYGNASISLYDPNSGNSVDDIYKPNNNNAPLGDVCQSINKINNKIYAVINNSAKIVVLNNETFVKEAVINGLVSPRFILPVSNNKAYVSNFRLTYSDNYIQVIDLNSGTVGSSIPCKGWTEEMALSYGKAFVTNRRSDYVYVINTATDQVQDSILVGYGSGAVVKDKNEKLWVLCSGDSATNQYPKLVRINPLNLQVESSISFPTFYNSPGNLKINGSGDVLYFLRTGVCNFSISSTALPAGPLIAETNHFFYSLGIDPVNETIYVSDAIDYIQKGKVLRYDKNGNYMDIFTAGIVPGNFYFDY